MISFSRFSGISLASALLVCATSICAQTNSPAVPAAPASQRPVAAPVNFNGIWVMRDYADVLLPQEGEPPYTEEVKRRMHRFKTEFDLAVDDPARFCVAMGMPWRMLNRARDYPLEIYQTPDRIFILFEGHDDRRSIHVGRTDVPENLPRAANGWSNARWDGNTLVITTSNLTARAPINTLQRSEDAVIEERWTMEKDPANGDVIHIDMTITDPIVYTHPVKARMVYKRAEPGVEIGGYNCMDALWEEHLEKREAELAAKKSTKAK